MFHRGEFVVINNDIGIVVRVGEELGNDAEDHTAVWFGTCENGKPEVWTIPTEYLKKGPQSVLRH